MSLKLGLTTAYWAAGPPPPSALETVKEAERLGFDSVWTSEAYGCDVLTPLAWWGSHTEKVRLGTAIMHQVYDPAFAEDVPYNVAVVELHEGVRLTTNVVGCANEELWIGMPLEVTFERVSEEVAIPKFRRSS